MEEEFDYIRSQLSRVEILAQLAEEAAELSQAALKLRRVLDGRNPTSIDYGLEIAKKELLEEMADVNVCVKALGMSFQREDIKELSSKKTSRWKNRLARREMLEKIYDLSF